MQQINPSYKIPETTMAFIFKNQPIDIWINSFGGCRSNYIRDLIKDTFRTYNAAYEFKACHYIRPLDVPVGSGIFCYVEDVGLALTSQINRDMHYGNFAKLLDEDLPYSPETWLNKINQQIDNWTSNTPFPVIIINTDRIMDNANIFKEMYGVNVTGFRPRGTSEYHESLLPYIDQIKEINTKLGGLPNYGRV